MVMLYSLYKNIDIVLYKSIIYSYYLYKNKISLFYFIPGPAVIVLGRKLALFQIKKDSKKRVYVCERKKKRMQRDYGDDDS